MNEPWTEAPPVPAERSAQIRALGRQKLARTASTGRLQQLELVLVVASSLLTLLWATNAVLVIG